MLPSSSESTSTGFHVLLKNRPFMTLWAGQILSQLADKVFFVLLIALIQDYGASPATENSMRSAVMIAATLPAIFLGSAAGIFVDRYNKRSILSGCNLWRGVMLLTVPFLPKAFGVLLAIALLESVLTQFFAPAEQAAIPFLVRRENLLTANALFSTTMMASLIVGFAIGDPILELGKFISPSWGREFLVGALYLLAGIVLGSVALREKPKQTEAVSVHPWSDFKAGLKYLKKDQLVSNAMLQLMILYSVLAALTVLAISLTAQIGLKDTQFGLLLAFAGVGMVLGAGILGHWGERFGKKPLPLIGFVCMAIVLTIFTFTSDAQFTFLLSVVFGFGASLVAVPMQTLIQHQTPEDMRGKVFGFQNNIVNIALSLPLAITGPLIDGINRLVGNPQSEIGLRSVLVGMSFIVTIVGIWAWRNTRRVLQKAL